MHVGRVGGGAWKSEYIHSKSVCGQDHEGNGDDDVGVVTTTVGENGWRWLAAGNVEISRDCTRSMVVSPLVCRRMELVGWSAGTPVVLGVG